MDLADWNVVTELLGREPQCSFEVVVRNPDGSPRVIRNDPLLYDGTPMPTRYWLVDPTDCLEVARLESAGGVRRADQEVDPEAIAKAHQRYAEERDSTLPEGYDGPKPTGGVGGTSVGVKCLHAHFAWLLAGGDCPVGKWILENSEPLRERFEVKEAGQ